MGPIFGLLLLTGLSFAEDPHCNGTIIHGIKYEEEIIKDNIAHPHHLSVDFSTNTLYFSFRFNNGSYRRLDAIYFDLNSNEYGTIPEVYGGGTAVDNKNHVVYLSGLDGIYTYNKATKEVKKIVETNGLLWQLFYNGDLYWTEVNKAVPTLYKGGKITKLVQIEKSRLDARNIAVDKNGVLWIGATLGLNYNDKDTEELYYYKKEEDKMVKVGNYTVTGFSLDKDENLYFSSNEGVYSIAEDCTIDKLFKRDQIYGVAIDADNNIIYSDFSRVIRLKRTDIRCSS